MAQPPPRSDEDYKDSQEGVRNNGDLAEGKGCMRTEKLKDIDARLNFCWRLYG